MPFSAGPDFNEARRAAAAWWQRPFWTSVHLLGGALLLLSVSVAAILPGPRSTQAAALGSMLAISGVIVLARPVLRLGYEAWLNSPVDLGTLSEPDERWRATMYQDDQDARAVQFIGPALIVFGTLLNGFSGYF